MEWVVLIVLVVLAVLAKSFLSRRQPRKQPVSGATPESYPYTANDVLLSAAERSFFGVLQQALSEGTTAFPKIRVADVLSVRGPLPKSEWRAAFNRISAKHFDFVVCSNSDLRISYVVELDDKSHARKDRADRDDFLEAACRAAGLKLVRVPARASYSVAELREQLAATELSAEAATSALRQQASRGTLSPVGHNAPPSCPKCSSTMVLRTAKSGANAGEQFWGCSTYPQCRGVLKHGAQIVPADASGG